MKISYLFFIISILAACESENKDTSSENINEECVPECPESESTFYKSDIPCDQEDDDPETIEESCTEVESCGVIIYCRATGV